jgi:hypothetical protein
MEFKHDKHTNHSGLLLQSRIKEQIQNHKSPHRTSLEEALVANSSVFHKPEICTKA